MITEYPVQVRGPVLGRFLNNDNNPEQKCSRRLEIGCMDRPAGWLLAIQKICGLTNFFLGKVITISADTSVQRRTPRGTSYTYVAELQ
jgi:hypothetical protein